MPPHKQKTYCGFTNIWDPVIRKPKKRWRGATHRLPICPWALVVLELGLNDALTVSETILPKPQRSGIENQT